MIGSTIAWLYKELPGLVSQGVLDEQAAARLRDHYGPSPEPDRAQRLLVLFGALGALLIGGGITLLLAHNWEELARPARAAISLSLLLAGQALAGWAVLRRRTSTAWTESAGAFLALAVVTALALISQTYQMGGPPETILLYSVLLTIPAVYLLDSRAALALVWIEMTAWLFADMRALPLTQVLWLVSLAAVTAPMLVRLQKRFSGEVRTALVGWVGAVCAISWLLRMAAEFGLGVWIPLLTGATACMYSLGAAPSAERRPGWRRPWEIYGALGVGVVLVLLSFPDVWAASESWDWGFPTPRTSVAVLLLAAALVACSGVLAVRRFLARNYGQVLVLGVPLLATLFWLFAPTGAGIQAVALGMNLYAVGAGLLVCVHGLREGRLGTANAGLLLLMTIVSARFLDAEWSFVARGLGFIVLGACFLSTNLWMVHSRRRLKEMT